MINALTHCSFCGHDETDGRILIIGPMVSICCECVYAAQEEVDKVKQIRKERNNE